MALPCVLLWLVVTHHPTCFLLLFIHNHTHLPLLVLCLVLSFSLSLSFSCLCVSVGDGGWAQCFRLFSEFVSVVPPVAITPPPPTPAGLGPASFLPVPLPHPSVLSSSSSSCCCKVDGKASEGFTNHTPPLCFVACPSLFCCVCCVCCVVAWWAWLVVVLVATPRLFRCHQCLCFQSFTTHPPRFTTQSQSLSSSCPCAHSFCHSLTHSQATPPRHTHTHTRGGWCTLVPGVCVCPRCWLWPRLARHSHVHPLLVPHTTPLLLLLLLLVVVVDVVVAAWVLWRVWPLGPLTGCAGAVHSRFTHTHTG